MNPQENKTVSEETQSRQLDNSAQDCQTLEGSSPLSNEQNHLTEETCFCKQNVAMIVLTREGEIGFCIKHLESFGMWLTHAKWSERQKEFGFTPGQCSNYRDGDFDEWIPPEDQESIPQKQESPPVIMESESRLKGDTE